MKKTCNDRKYSLAITPFVILVAAVKNHVEVREPKSRKSSTTTGFSIELIRSAAAEELILNLNSTIPLNLPVHLMDFITVIVQDSVAGDRPEFVIVSNMM
jgi:hypothetical protein